jgi:hypothetical protein
MCSISVAMNCNIVDIKNGRIQGLEYVRQVGKQELVNIVLPTEIQYFVRFMHINNQNYW